jgi:hypothetical protein
MDSTWKVKKVQPGIMMLEDGKSRHLGPNAIFDHVWNDCMKLMISNLERSQPALVGSQLGKNCCVYRQMRRSKGRDQRSHFGSGHQKVHHGNGNGGHGLRRSD